MEAKPRRWVAGTGLRLAVCVLALAAGCSREPSQTPLQRAEGAKALFDRATKEFHNPSALASGTDQARLQDQAAAAYRRLLADYPEQSNWCSQALRHLGSIHAARTNLDEALKCYAAVAQKYPAEDWEVLQAWKAAADLLWDSGRRDEAAGFYRQIVRRFDGTNQPAVIQLTVKGSKNRLTSP